MTNGTGFSGHIDRCQGNGSGGGRPQVLHRKGMSFSNRRGRDSRIERVDARLVVGVHEIHTVDGENLAPRARLAGAIAAGVLGTV